MSENVYKVIEIVGSSKESWEKAAAAAVETTAKHLQDLRIAEVTDMDLQITEGKVVAYRGRGDEGRFATLPEASLTVELLDPNREVVASQAVTTNSFGTASGGFQVPVGRLLGSWSLRASLGGESAIRVEEYKRPTFEVELSDPEAALRLNRPATLGGEARYYFGLPVGSGDVTWQVSREPVYPRWWYWYYSPAAQAQTVAAGTTELDADGRFRFTFEPEADEREAGSRQVTYRYRVNVEVTDEGGETRSASRVFRLGFVAVEARLEAGVSQVDIGGGEGDAARQRGAPAGARRMAAAAARTSSSEGPLSSPSPSSSASTSASSSSSVGMSPSPVRVGAPGRAHEPRGLTSTDRNPPGRGGVCPTCSPDGCSPRA